MENPIKNNQNNAPFALEETLSLAEKLHDLDRPNAPLSLRFACRALDAIFVYLLINGMEKLFQALSPVFENGFLLGYVDLLFRLAFLFGYTVLVSAEFGGTLGQVLLGVKVIDSKTGEKLSVGISCLRLLWLLATNILSLIVALTRKDRRCLHDLVSNTVVKKVRGRG